jgi:hypothetical protein
MYDSPTSSDDSGVFLITLRIRQEDFMGDTGYFVDIIKRDGKVRSVIVLEQDLGGSSIEEFLKSRGVERYEVKGAALYEPSLFQPSESVRWNISWPRLGATSRDFFPIPPMLNSNKKLVARGEEVVLVLTPTKVHEKMCDTIQERTMEPMSRSEANSQRTNRRVVFYGGRFCFFNYRAFVYLVRGIGMEVREPPKTDPYPRESEEFLEELTKYMEWVDYVFNDVFIESNRQSCIWPMFYLDFDTSEKTLFKTSCSGPWRITSSKLGRKVKEKLEGEIQRFKEEKALPS